MTAEELLQRLYAWGGFDPEGDVAMSFVLELAAEAGVDLEAFAIARTAGMGVAA